MGQSVAGLTSADASAAACVCRDDLPGRPWSRSSPTCSRTETPLAAARLQLALGHLARRSAYLLGRERTSQLLLCPGAWHTGRAQTDTELMYLGEGSLVWELQKPEERGEKEAALSTPGVPQYPSGGTKIPSHPFSLSYL